MAETAKERWNYGWIGTGGKMGGDQGCGVVVLPAAGPGPGHEQLPELCRCPQRAEGLDLCTVPPDERFCAGDRLFRWDHLHEQCHILPHREDIHGHRCADDPGRDKLPFPEDLHCPVHDAPVLQPDRGRSEAAFGVRLMIRVERLQSFLVSWLDLSTVTHNAGDRTPGAGVTAAPVPPQRVPGGGVPSHGGSPRPGSGAGRGRYAAVTTLWLFFFSQ